MSEITSGPHVSGEKALAGAQVPQSKLIIQGIRAHDLLTGQMIYEMFTGERKTQ